MTAGQRRSSPAPVRSTGSAGRGSTVRRSSRRCWTGDAGAASASPRPSPFTTTRRYLGETAVLETTFHTANGVTRLTDLMPVASEAEKARELSPDHELLRRVECLEGTVEIDVLFDPRLDYGRTIPRLIDRQAFGLVCEHRAQVIALRSEIPLVTAAALADGIRRSPIAAHAWHAGARA